MNVPPDYAREPILLSALLTPHRSLSGRGFIAVIAVIAAVSFAAGAMFLRMGAWPVFGFFGLDVALIYAAFRISYRRARAYEEIIVTPSELHIRKVSHRGDIAEWRFNPLWVRLEREVDDDFGVQRLALMSQGRHLDIGNFLGPEEKLSFFNVLGAALGAARRGPDRSQPA